MENPIYQPCSFCGKRHDPVQDPCEEFTEATGYESKEQWRKKLRSERGEEDA